MMQTNALGEYEGLVFTTARMFASQVKMEEEDLCQELRIVVWKASSRYDPAKTRTSARNFVYGCVANRIKDLKRNAARRAKHGLTFDYIEDDLPGFEVHMYETPDQVFGRIDEGLLTLPAAVTRREAEVLVLLMFDMTEREIRLRLRLSRAEVVLATGSLRTKLADWSPGGTTQLVELDAVAA